MLNELSRPTEEWQVKTQLDTGRSVDASKTKLEMDAEIDTVGFDTGESV